MAGAGGMVGHGGYASALLDRIPPAWREQDRGDSGEQGATGRRQGDGGTTGQGVFQGAPAATYWRRRFVILAIGLSLLAAASWTLSEALTVSPASPQRAGQSGQGAGATTLPTRTWHPGDRTSGDAAGQASASSGQGSGTGLGARHQPKASPSATTSGFSGFKPAFCSWHSIVLSLSAAQVQYGPGQQPSFSLSIVSTQPNACSFNVGPSHLTLVIKEGPARIWSSADCVNGSGSLVAALHRGVPTVVTIDWNRMTSSPGCSGPARSVPAGTYTGYAVDGSLTSGPVPIRLS